MLTGILIKTISSMYSEQHTLHTRRFHLTRIKSTQQFSFTFFFIAVPIENASPVYRSGIFFAIRTSVTFRLHRIFTVFAVYIYCYNRSQKCWAAGVLGRGLSVCMHAKKTQTFRYGDLNAQLVEWQMCESNAMSSAKHMIAI